MAQYIIVNHCTSILDGVKHRRTSYYCGTMWAGEFHFERWDSSSKKDAYVFENKAEANRYFRKHKLQERNDMGMTRISYNFSTQDNYEIIKVEKGER